MSINEIVIVDNDLLFIDEMKLALCAAYYEIRSTDGLDQTFISACDNAGFIILNPFIPGRDGFLWLKEIAKLASPPSVVVVGSEAPDVLNAVSALATSSGLNVAAVLRKPVSPVNIVSAIRLAQAQARSATLAISSANDMKIKRAIHNSRIPLFFQPKISMLDFSFSGAEALLSGEVPGLGFVAPNYIVQVATKNVASANQLAEFTLNRGLDAFLAWRANGLAGAVSVNIPLKTLESDHFVNFASQSVSKRGLVPDNLIIELSENDLYETSPCGLQNLIKLRMIGFGIALDDFGQKYSGIGRLGKLPFTEVKIDIGIVQLARWSQLARNLIKYLIDLCASSGISVTVEGVERAADLYDLPRRSGVFIQGHLALPKLALDELLIVGHGIPAAMSSLAGRVGGESAL